MSLTPILGLHRETFPAASSEIQREIRRRTWCVLDTWDWFVIHTFPRQSLNLTLSAGKCRPDSGGLR
jgi:hypothetical protein